MSREAEAKWLLHLLALFPGAKVVEAPRGMREAVVKVAKKGAK